MHSILPATSFSLTTDGADRIEACSRVLKYLNDSGVCPAMLAYGRDRRAAPADFAANDTSAGIEQSADRIRQHRLAGPAFTNQTDDFSRLDGEVNAIKSLDDATTCGEVNG